MKPRKMRFKEGDTVFVVACDSFFMPTEFHVSPCTVKCAQHGDYMLAYPDGGVRAFREDIPFASEWAAHAFLAAYAGVIHDRETKLAKELKEAK